MSLKWKTKEQTKRDEQLATLLTIRQRAFDLLASLRGPEVPQEVTQCWVTAVLETLSKPRPGHEEAYNEHPTEYVDAMLTVAKGRHPLLLTGRDYEAILKLYRLNTGKDNYVDAEEKS